VRSWQKEGGKSEDVAVVHRVDDATLLVLGLKVVPADRAFAFTQLLYQHLPACEECARVPHPPRPRSASASVHQPWFCACVCVDTGR
jgi:hypothetical protein